MPNRKPGPPLSVRIKRRQNRINKTPKIRALLKLGELLTLKEIENLTNDIKNNK